MSSQFSSYLNGWNESNVTLLFIIWCSITVSPIISEFFILRDGFRFDKQPRRDKQQRRDRCPCNKGYSFIIRWSPTAASFPSKIPCGNCRFQRVGLKVYRMNSLRRSFATAADRKKGAERTAKRKRKAAEVEYWKDKGCDIISRKGSTNKTSKWWAFPKVALHFAITTSPLTPFIQALDAISATDELNTSAAH